MTVSNENAAFWNELCGTSLARSLGITELTPDSLARFDAAYFAYYPYLRPIVTRAGVATGSVLEIGVGYGSLGQFVAASADEYRAVDIAEAPVALLRQRLAFLGLPTEHVRQASALDLPFSDDSFDSVISIGALHHTGDLPRAIAEVRRVLRPGGTALIMVYNGRSLRRVLAVARNRLAALLHRAPDTADAQLRGMYDRRMDGAVAPHTDFVSARDVHRLFRNFGDVRIDRRNFDDYVVSKLWLRRAWFLGSLDRLVGLDLYVTATK